MMRNHLAIGELRLGSRLALQIVLAFRLIPVIHEHIGDDELVAQRYTYHGNAPSDLGQHHNLESILLFRQPLFHFMPGG
jgi:hypothetical protein